jgi:hypothetical protein
MRPSRSTSVAQIEVDYGITNSLEVDLYLSEVSWWLTAGDGQAWSPAGPINVERGGRRRGAENRDEGGISVAVLVTKNEPSTDSADTAMRRSRRLW